MQSLFTNYGCVVAVPAQLGSARPAHYGADADGSAALAQHALSASARFPWQEGEVDKRARPCATRGTRLTALPQRFNRRWFVYHEHLHALLYADSLKGTEKCKGAFAAGPFRAFGEPPRAGLIKLDANSLVERAKADGKDDLVPFRIVTSSVGPTWRYCAKPCVRRPRTFSPGARWPSRQGARALGALAHPPWPTPPAQLGEHNCRARQDA
jgi:hypothetical protein